MKILKVILIIIGLILIFFPMIISSNSFEKEKKMYNCVDGKGGVNLEGIKCERTVETCFGSEEFCRINSMILILFAFIGIWVIAFAISLKWKAN